MIIQFYTPSVLCQCRECKHLKKCKDGQRNPSATFCRSGEATKKASERRNELQKKFAGYESIDIS